MSTKTLKIFGLLFAFMLLLGAGCAMTDDTAMEGEANINTEEESEGPETDAEAQAEFVSSLEASFNALNADFEALSARVEADSRELSEETMQRWEELKTELETSRQEARTEIENLREAGADSWIELKVGADTAVSDFASAYTNAKEEMEAELQVE